ncbi:RICIN domain-containing protein [Streptomyces galbus]|uniref:Ricin-type beta-trefoil lectin domain protein n=1 Tax=Streptomyces galbus TaxID=33898 RepID=A0ABX1IRF8_STRGB|nr:ricin-type beta-trefoil lectin domain protein [Streptomyces galbus]NKQ28219.1 ricin-type beta-trefoil lectin domain protein [Streptomyces galbus]
MIRTVRRAGVVAALCLVISTAAGTASAAPQADAIQTFRNKWTGNCLDHNNRDGVRQYPCNSGNYQKWQVHVFGDGTRRLQNVATGKCLTYNQLGGALVDVTTCGTSQEESWYVLQQSGGGIAFQNQYKHDCLHAAGGYSVGLNSCYPTDLSQTWT